jgi:hypothetical protein
VLRDNYLHGYADTSWLHVQKYAAWNFLEFCTNYDFFHGFAKYFRTQPNPSFQYRLQTEVTVIPPIPAEAGGMIESHFRIHNTLGHLLQLKYYVSDKTHKVIVYYHRRSENVYKVVYKSSFYLDIFVFWSTFFQNFYVFHFNDEFKLYDYKKGKLTGRVEIKDENTCSRPKDRVGDLLLMVQAFIQCKTKSGVKHYRFYTMKFTRDEEDIVRLTNYTDIYIVPGIFALPFVLSNSAVLFVGYFRGKMNKWYYYNLSDVHKPVIMKHPRRCHRCSYRHPPGYNFFLVSTSSLSAPSDTSYAVLISCDANKTRDGQTHIIRPASVNPIPSDHGPRGSLMFNEIGSFRVCSKQNKILRRVSFYQLTNQ